MEIGRLRPEQARVKMERDILEKATAARAACAEPVLIEVGLYQPSSTVVNRRRRVWPISLQCRVLEASVAGYHRRGLQP